MSVYKEQILKFPIGFLIIINLVIIFIYLI